MAKNHEDMYAVLDLNACLMHAYHGAQDEEPLIGAEGTDIKRASAGFNAFLDLYVNSILEDFQPRQMLVAIDRGTDYQSELLENYKGDRKERKKLRDPLEVQEIEKLKDLAKRFLLQIGATIAGVKGVEADDVIGYLVENLPGYKNVYSVDSDFVQLLGGNNEVELFLKNEVVDQTLDGHTTSDAAEPVPFKHWRLFRSLVGKGADSYKGVKGFGKAAWTSLCDCLGEDGLVKMEQALADSKWHLLDSLPIPDKIRIKLDEQRADWEVSYLLAGLHPDLCWKPRNGKIPKIDYIKRVGSEAEFAKIMRLAGVEDRISEFSDYLPQEWLIDASNFAEEDVEEFRQAVLESPHVSFDYESYSPYADHEPFKKAAKGRYVDVLTQSITGVSFNFGANLQYTFYLSVNHADTDNLPLSVIRQFLEAIPPEKVLVAQNAPFEITLTKTNLDLTLEDVHDTAIMQVYVDEEQETGLKQMSKRLLNYRQTSYEEVTDGLPMNEISAARVVSYGCDDSLVTGRIYDLLKLTMLLENTWNLYINDEPLVANVTAHSYIKGNEIDFDFIEAMHKKNRERYSELKLELHRLMGQHEFAPSAKLAREFFEADEDFLKKSQRDKFKKTKQAETTSFADYWRQFKTDTIAGYMEACVYHPFTTKVVSKEFVPTKANLFSLIEQMGFEVKPQSYSIRSLKAWAEQHLITDWESGQDQTQHRDFVEALDAAAANIVKAADRSGKNYERLLRVASEFIGDRDDKVVTEGDELSEASPKQMQEMLYLKLGLPVRMHSKVQPGSARSEYGVQGSPATSELAINWALAEDMAGPDDWRIPILNTLKEMKSLVTQMGLFDVPYPLWKHPEDGRIHPSIRNCGAKATKRMSGSAPNVMQVSAKTDMREAFLPLQGEGEEHILIGIDWSGQELRIVAGECKDKNMLSAYVGKPEELRDLHSMTGSGIASMPYSKFYAAYKDEGSEQHEEVNKIRKQAKAVNFLLCYGGSASTLAQNIIVPRETADKMMDNTYSTYPDLVKWQTATVKEARKVGYVTTFFGGRKHAHPDLFSQDKGRRSRVERQLVNFKVQGCAANQLKRLFTMMWRTGVIQDLGVGFVLPIHDEVFASVPRKHAYEYVRRMVKLMKMPVPNCAVPMEVDVAVSGISWGHMRELGGNPSQADIEDALQREVEEVA